MMNQYNDAVSLLGKGDGKLSQVYEKSQDWQNYIHFREDVYGRLLPDYVEENMISEANWVLRGKYASGEEIGVHVSPGDICYTDYGQNYLNECGYQHFGLVMTVCRRKALVIPMTSNQVQYESAYDEKDNPNGKIHLMRIGKPPGMPRNSVLFMNDMRFINTARVIDTKSHISTDSQLFRAIQMRMMQILFSRKTA